MVEDHSEIVNLRHRKRLKEEEEAFENKLDQNPSEIDI